MAMLQKGLLLLLTFLFLLNISKALECSVRNSCLANETCILSLYNTANAHAGSCDYYSYKICCDEISAGIYDQCPSNMAEILSLYQVNNTHVAHPGYYSHKLCAGYTTYPINCQIRDGSCLTNETCVLSLYSSENAHIADCSYYRYKLCCERLPDLYVNESSIQPNETNPLWGTVIDINVQVWNIGDATANQVNVSCYENGILFDSKLISSIAPGQYAYATCKWNVSCNTNISVFVDPKNAIRELNESNNQAWKVVPITERLLITILYPHNGDRFYRGQTISLNSSTASSCSSLPPHNVYWYNESTFIGQGDNITWTIPLSDDLLGNKTIKAIANYSGYYTGEDSVNITILNNLPRFSEIYYNVTPPEVQSGEGIEIMCDVYDVEDCPSSSNCHLQTNISIKRPDGVQINYTANQIGNTFYIDYTAPYSPLGNYTAICSAVDSDNGYNESAPSTFLVWQNATVTISLNASDYWWNSPVKISGYAKRLTGTAIANGNVEVLLLGTNVCPLAGTDATGYYECDFTSPPAVGNYSVLVKVTDPLTGKTFGNVTYLVVSPYYGESPATAKNVGCYQVPQLIQNPDGSIKKVWVRICIWK